MASVFKTAGILLGAALLWSQILFSSALTEEERLRAAISDFSTTSFELKSTIKLTKELPPLKLLSGRTRTLRIFSRGGFSLSGAKKWRGIFTPNGLAASATYPVAALTFDNVKLIDFRVAVARGQVPTGPVIGSAIGVEKTSVTLTNCSFSRLITTGVYVSQGNLVVKKSTFSRTNAVKGGAISFVNGRALTIEDSEFTANFASTGGAVSVEGPAVIRVARTIFKENSAFNAGAFSVDFGGRVPSSPILFDSSTFESNVASNLDDVVAGAVLLTGVKEITFNKPTFKNNIVPPFTADNLAAGTPNDILVVTATTDKTTIRIVSGAIRFIKGNVANNFVIA